MWLIFLSVGLYLFNKKICQFSQPTEHKLSAKYVEGWLETEQSESDYSDNLMIFNPEWVHL